MGKKLVDFEMHCASSTLDSAAYIAPLNAVSDDWRPVDVVVVSDFEVKSPLKTD